MRHRPGRGATVLADSPRWLYGAPGQLRAPWRLLTFAACLFLAQGIAESFIAPIFEYASAIAGEPLPGYPWTMLAAVLAAVAFTLRTVDDDEWESVALGHGAWSPRAILRGLALGAGAIGATAALLWIVGAFRIEAAPLLDGSESLTRAWSATALRLLFMLAPAALWEELIFRGYLWHVAADAGGARMARWSTSVAFSAVHFLNPGAGVRTAVLVLLAGFCLGLIRERLDSLPAAWGAHLAWNWIMAAVLHVPVSGLALATPGYRGVLNGPDWLTGGVWGPEGGAIAALIMVSALLWLEWPHRNEYLWTRTRGTRSASDVAAATRS